MRIGYWSSDVCSSDCKGAAVKSELQPIQFRHGAGPGFAGDGKQAAVNERPVERRIVRDNDVGGRKALDGRRPVSDLTSKVIRREPRQFGDPGVELDARILTPDPEPADRSEEHTSELQSLMSISSSAFFLKTKNIIR